MRSNLVSMRREVGASSNIFSRELKGKIEQTMDLTPRTIPISKLLSQILSDAIEFKEESHSKLIELFEKELKKLCSKEVSQKLDSQTLKELKEPMIDFLYRLKDKHPSSSEGESYNVAHRVMNFMWKNMLNPSDALIEEYRQSKTNKTLNLFPSKEDWMKIWMSKEDYEGLKKAYSSRPEFIYYFDPDLDIQTKIEYNYDGDPKCIKIGFFEKGKKDTLTMAGVKIGCFGWLEQGYYKDGELEYYGRVIDEFGKSYTGGYKQGNWNGKGEYEWEDRSREIAYYVDRKKEGAAKYYDKNGNEEDRFYKNDELVKQ